MKLSEAIQSLGNTRAQAVAREHVALLHLDWHAGVKHVFQACLVNTSLIPGNIGSKGDTAEGAINKWVEKYIDGYNNRISQHASNLPATIADPCCQ